MAISVLGGIYSGHHGPPTPQGATYAIVGATATERQLVEEVHDRFTAEGLHLPDSLRVAFTDQREVCRWYDGLYSYGQALVNFCRPTDDEWELGELVIHEFAHAWDDHNMTKESRSHYMSTMNVDPSASWLDPDLPHDRRPGERFAGTMSGLLQGLIDTERFHELTGVLAQPNWKQIALFEDTEDDLIGLGQPPS